MAGTDVNEGPVLNLINKRLRNLRKKLNRITQMEESLAQGKVLNKEQEETFRSKPSILANIEELEKLRQPLSAAVAEEINLAVERHQVSSAPSTTTTEINAADPDEKFEKSELVRVEDNSDRGESVMGIVEDLLNLLYFGSMFDVKSQSDFTATMLTRTHERGCCLTYDYVTDEDAADHLLGERDLDLISMLGGLLISRPPASSLSHKNALQQCAEHAKMWLSNSDQPIEPNSNITYAGLREKLNKIMASDYFTTTPEMKGPVEMAAAAGNYSSFQVPVHGSIGSINVPIQVESSVEQYEQKEEELDNSQGNEIYDNQPGTEEEVHQGGHEVENLSEFSAQPDSVPEGELGQNSRDVELKEQQYAPRRSYQNYRGGRGGSGGGRRGYSNGRGGRGSGRGGTYQNGRSQYYDQPGNYYPRNNYSYRGGRGGRGGGNYNHYVSAGQAGNVPADS